LDGLHAEGADELIGVLIKRVFLIATLAAFAKPGLAQETASLVNWSGTYLGAFALHSLETVRGNSKLGDGGYGSNAADEAAHDSFRGAGLGLLLGYQHHYANGIIVGVEADWAWLGQEGQEDTLVDSGNAWNGMVQTSINRETRWLSTLRATIGYAEGPLMIHASGGLASASLAETRTQYQGVSGPTQTVARFSDTDEKIAFGWTLGVGAGWRFSQAASLRLDYIHTQFDDVGFSFPNARGGVATSYTSVQGRSVHNDVTIQMIRFGLTYAFGAAP
jgi:opacity protein-like surface antigen